MFYSDYLTDSLEQEKILIDHMISQLRIGKDGRTGFPRPIEGKRDSSKAVLDEWLIRTGDSPKSNLAVSEIGIYTDFT